MSAERTSELRGIAEQITRALPSVVDEVVLTGSVSRGVADDLSDIEMLLVTSEELDLSACFEHARIVGLVGLDTWGPQGTDVCRVFGYFETIPIELTWWPRAHGEKSVAALLQGKQSAAAEAIANGLPLRTSGLLQAWQEQLRVYPDGLAAALIEDAALTWGGFHPTGFLTLARPGERLALIERLVDDASRVLQIVYAVNRVWQPTSKRLAARVDVLALKPERLAERIEAALSELDPLQAMLTMSELQAEALLIAPSGPNVDRARGWVGDVIEVIREARRLTEARRRTHAPDGAGGATD